MNFAVRVVIIGSLAIAAIWWSVDYAVKYSVERAVKWEAVDKAEHWGHYMADEIPDLERLLITGTASAAQQKIIHQVSMMGDIFRFKLFKADATLSYISDEPDFGTGDQTGAVLNIRAEQVIQTGQSIVDIHDGTAKPDRPDLYAEAYIPMVGPEGNVLGVVEVYVDQTMTRMYFVESFHNFGLMLVAFIAIVCAIPGIGFCLQRMMVMRSRRDAEFLARFDPLTGLLNRREFVHQAGRLIENGKVSVVCYLDLDNFKAINDTHGHSIGDAFLIHVAEVMRKNCDASDLLARFGGDEFVIAFHETEAALAAQKARAILKDCAQEMDVDTAKLTGSLSIGLAEVEGKTLERALSDADAALYHVKSTGRNDFAMYGDEMGQELRRRNELQIRLRDATQNCDFQIHYQPLVDGVTCAVIGYEALLRLNDYDGTPIPPATFIPLAEEMNLIDDIGRWTINAATKEMAGFDDNVVLAINLSTVQFQSGNLVETVKNALEAANFPANRLELEITESLLLEDSALIEMQIDALKDMGVAIAMDDFGTGFSSLSYLWKYGFDRLKIDRSFVMALDENPIRSREIIQTVVMLGARLGMKITAEGVETSEQSELLSSLGCDVLQGYLFGKASPLGTPLSLGFTALSDTQARVQSRSA